MPTIREDTFKLETSLPVERSDSIPSTPQVPQANNMRRLPSLRYVTEYFGILATRNLSLYHSGTLQALGKIRNSPLNVWPSISKFAYVERDKLLTTVLVA